MSHHTQHCRHTLAYVSCIVATISSSMAMNQIDNRYEDSCEKGCCFVCLSYSLCASYGTLLYLITSPSHDPRTRANNFAFATTLGGLLGTYLGTRTLAAQNFPCDHSYIYGTCKKYTQQIKQHISHAPRHQKMT
jgi:hypothetical protein